MKTFGFCYIKDKSREIINKGQFEDVQEAILHFSEVKNLSVSSFVKIYKVVLLNDK